jgi:hypothetical protein
MNAAHTAISKKLNAMTIDELAEIAASMFTNDTDEGAVVLEFALAALESKMPESDFIRFCEKF